MASRISFSNFRTLAQLAAKTQVICHEVCGVQSEVNVEVKRLYIVLRRLQQEASMSGSNLIAPCKENLLLEMSNCKQSLDNCHNFLSTYKALSDIEKQISIWTASTSLSSQQLALIDLISDKFVQHASRLAEILITASVESIDPLNNRLANAGYPLRIATTNLTARLIARNDLERFGAIQSPTIGLSRWDVLQGELLLNGFAMSFLALHKNEIVAYVETLEKRSAFDSNGRLQSFEGQKSLTNMKAGAQETSVDAKHIAFKDHGSNLNSDEGRQETHTSQKRTRPDVSDYPLPTFESKTKPSIEFPNGESGPSYKASDPHPVYKKIKEDNPFLEDDERLLAVLGEDQDLSSPSSLWNEIRRICFQLCKRYEPRVKALLAQELRSENEYNNEYRSLHSGIEKHVVDKLDQFGTFEDEKLSNFRKKIINKAKRMLTKLEASKDKKN